MNKHSLYGSQSSTNSVVARLQGWLSDERLFDPQESDFFSSAQGPYRFWKTPSLAFRWVQCALYSNLGSPGIEFNVTSIYCQNYYGWIYVSTLTKHFNSVSKDNCTSTPVVFALKCISIYAKGILRRGSEATRFLWLQFRIPPGVWIFSVVSVACCRVGVSAIVRSLVQRSPTECGVFKCDIENSTTTKPRSTRFVEPRKNAKENMNTGLHFSSCGLLKRL
jgi:hypothetical protein